MLFGFLIFLFIILCFMLIFLILLQKGKSSMGLGSLGGGTQLLFGGSGGQDLFQKVTWALGGIFMGGSLVLAMMKRPTSELISKLASRQQATVQVPAVPAQPATPVPSAPAKTKANQT
jgi:preprotein translocase subunit SecG